MAAHSHDNGTAAGTIGGTLLSIIANIHSGDLVKTAILACVGATVSFVVSMLLKALARRRRKK